MATAPQRILAFDHGLRHIGVAIGETFTGGARGLTELRARQGQPDWAAVQKLVAEWQPGTLVVGLPLNMDGSDSRTAPDARRFARRLHGRLGLPVVLVDERLSTREAGDRLHASGRNPGRLSGAQHAEAAVVIAEGWLRDGAGEQLG